MKIFILTLLIILMIRRASYSNSTGFRTVSPSIPKDRPNKERCIKTEPTTKTVPPKNVPMRKVKQMRTYYTIIQAPIRIEFDCHICHWSHAIDWNDVESYGGEYGKWTGDICAIQCENCGEEVEFNACEVD